MSDALTQKPCQMTYMSTAALMPTCGLEAAPRHPQAALASGRDGGIIVVPPRPANLARHRQACETRIAVQHHARRADLDFGRSKRDITARAGDAHGGRGRCNQGEQDA